MTKQELEGLIAEMIAKRHGSDVVASEVTRVLGEEMAKRDAEASTRRERIATDQSVHPYCAKYAGPISRDKVNVRGKQQDRQGLGLRAARVMRALAGAALLGRQGKNISAADYALQNWGDAWIGDALAQAADERKGLTGGMVPAATGGGALVPVEYQREVIELLNATAQVRASGATQLPLGGKLTMSRMTTGATATYGAENAAINASQPNFDQINLSPKRLTVIVPISNSLLITSDPSADAIVRNEMVNRVALREDIAFLREPSGGDGPTGITTLIGAGQKQNQSGATVTAIVNDVADLFELVEGANTPMLRPVWFFNTRTKNQLLSKVTVDELLAFGEMLARGEFFGWPIFLENQIPKNLGGGSDSEMFFGDASEIVIGDTRMLDMEVFPGGAYNDSGGTLVSGLSRDETVVKLTSEHDVNLRHTTSFALQEQVNL